MSLIRLSWAAAILLAGVSVWSGRKSRAVLPCIRAQAGSGPIEAARRMIFPGTADVKGINFAADRASRQWRVVSCWMTASAVSPVPGNTSHVGNQFGVGCLGNACLCGRR